MWLRMSSVSTLNWFGEFTLNTLFRKLGTGIVFSSVDIPVDPAWRVNELESVPERKSKSLGRTAWDKEHIYLPQNFSMWHLNWTSGEQSLSIMGEQIWHAGLWLNALSWTSVVKKEAIDKDSQWLHLQKFMLDAICPLVVAFEELSSEEPDTDCMSTATSLAVSRKYQCILWPS